jgi:hypothetical protein
MPNWNPLNQKHGQPLSEKVEEAKKQQAIDEANQQAIDIAHRIFGRGQHGGTPSAPHLDSIVLGSHSIAFEDAPVGGSASLSVWPDGRYQFSGHLHDSGGPSYDYGVVFVLAGSAGTAFVFKRKGHLGGTMPGSGSRDDDWGDSDTNQAIKDAWMELSAGYQWRLTAEVNADLGELVDAATKTVGAVTKVIEIAAA